VNTTHSPQSAEGKAAEAPSLLCLEKKDGTLIWKDSLPGNEIVGPQHGSPLTVKVKDAYQTIVCQADGWIRGFDAKTGAVLWKFDLNSERRAAPRRRSLEYMTSIPVFHNNRIYATVGAEAECCSGQGRLLCIDPSGSGDVSDYIVLENGVCTQNKQSKLVWDYRNAPGENGPIMSRSIAGVAIDNGLVIAADGEGIVHCIDENSGEALWTYGGGGCMHGSPLIIGSKCYIGTEEGNVCIIDVAKKQKVSGSVSMGNDQIEVGPVFSDGILYVVNRQRMFAIPFSSNDVR
jgi:outer membrane protein assembly factor BamB